ncbi:MAG: hypothetical protein FJ292_01965 [Planctomycetes bacterium]|nr:hypothetical protein [Planctomycetota bacterium]
MRRSNRGTAAALAGAASLWLCACSARADVVANWNFNGLSGAVPTALGADQGTGSLSLLEFTGGLSALAGTDLYAWGGDVAGMGLVVTGSGQNGRAAVLEVRTEGLVDLVFGVAARRSGSGFAMTSVQVWDGIGWRMAGSIDASTTQWQVHTVDLSAFDFLEQTASARVRVVVDGATSSSGNIRLDNLRLSATPVPGPGPVAAIGAVAASVTRRRGGRKSAVKVECVKPVSAETKSGDDQLPTPPSSVPGSDACERTSARGRSGRTSG